MTTRASVELAGEDDLSRLEASPLTLLTFYTPAFRQHRTVVEEVGSELGEFLTVAFVDIVAQPAIAARFAVSGLPVSVLLRKGTLARRLSGTLTKEAYLRAVNEALASDPAWHLHALRASGEPLALHVAPRRPAA